MATLSGHRRTAGAAAAIAATLLAAGPTMGATPASAADSQTVTFTGGSVLSALVCKSTPSPPQLTVAARSRVMFVNRLGRTATLRVDGAAVATVGANQAVPVVFLHGPVGVQMTFGCSAGVVAQFPSATVVVTGAPVSASASGTTTGSGPSAGGAGRVTPDARTGTGRTTVPPRASERTDGAAPGTETLEPNTADDPAFDAGSVFVPPAGTDGGAGGNSAPVSIGTVVPASGTPEGSASSLLALLAAVCVVGVTIAASRAIITKRTIQARLA